MVVEVVVETFRRSSQTLGSVVVESGTGSEVGSGVVAGAEAGVEVEDCAS